MTSGVGGFRPEKALGSGKSFESAEGVQKQLGTEILENFWRRRIQVLKYFFGGGT